MKHSIWNTSDLHIYANDNFWHKRAVAVDNSHYNILNKISRFRLANDESINTLQSAIQDFYIAFFLNLLSFQFE